VDPGGPKTYGSGTLDAKIMAFANNMLNESKKERECGGPREVQILSRTICLSTLMLSRIAPGLRNSKLFSRSMIFLQHTKVRYYLCIIQVSSIDLTKNVL